MTAVKGTFIMLTPEISQFILAAYWLNYYFEDWQSEVHYIQPSREGSKQGRNRIRKNKKALHNVTTSYHHFPPCVLFFLQYFFSLSAEQKLETIRSGRLQEED
jgi:hypothetical protein